MHVGLNYQGKLVYLTSMAQAQRLMAMEEEFYCPSCGGVLKICWGPKRQPYFKHQVFSAHLSNESSIHRQGKILLARAGLAIGVPVQLEKVLSQEGQVRRVDVLIGTQLAGEFQCSPLAIPLLKKRNDFYRQLGWQSLWVLGPQFLRARTIAPAALKFLKYHQKLGFYLLFLVVAQKKVIVYHHIRKYDWQKYRWVTETCPIEQLFIHSFAQKPVKLPEVPSAQTLKQLRKGLQRRDSRLLVLQELCYRHGYDLLNLSEDLIVPQGFWPLFNSKLELNLCQFFRLPAPTPNWSHFPLISVN